MSTFHNLHFVQGNNEYDYYPQVDDTLSVEGRAADAKVTRDKIDSLRSDLNDVEEVVFETEYVIDATDVGDSEGTPSATIKIPHLYNFEVGKKYTLEVEIVSASFKTQSGALRANTSKVTNDSTAYLNTEVLNINNNSTHQINNGDVYTAEFTAVENDKNMLMRYILTSGIYQIKIKCSTLINVIPSIEEDVESLNDKITLIPNQSRMQFGAHRGAESFAPPNCVGAYEIAGKMGFQWAWLAQLRTSADGTIYVMHDADVSITTNGTGNIQDLTDEYIDNLLCNKITSYDYSQFTDDDLRVPTLEKVIQICVKYGMKMCFRTNNFPSPQITADFSGITWNSTADEAVWDTFADLVKSYNIKDAIYSPYSKAQIMATRIKIGEDAKIGAYVDGTWSAQDYIDFFARQPKVEGERMVLMPKSVVTLEEIKLLHKNDTDICVFYNSTRITETEANQWATYGVDILQCPNMAKLAIN